MHPQKPGLGKPFEGAQGHLGDLVAPAFRGVRAELGSHQALVVVVLEALVQALVGHQGPRGDDRRRVVAVGRQGLREGLQLRTRRVAGVVADAVYLRVQPGHQ